MLRGDETMIEFLKRMFDKLFPVCTPHKCDRCKREIKNKFVSVDWGNYRYVCMNCFRYYRTFDKQGIKEGVENERI